MCKKSTRLAQASKTTKSLSLKLFIYFDNKFQFLLRRILIKSVNVSNRPETQIQEFFPSILPKKIKHLFKKQNKNIAKAPTINQTFGSSKPERDCSYQSF